MAGPATTRLGIEAAFASVMTAARAAMTEAGLVEGDAVIQAGIGLAGVGRLGALEALMAQPNPFVTMAFVSDGLAACLGAHLGADGAIVIAGTGSIGLGRVAGRELRVGATASRSRTKAAAPISACSGPARLARA